MVTPCYVLPVVSLIGQNVNGMQALYDFLFIDPQWYVFKWRSAASVLRQHGGEIGLDLQPSKPVVMRLGGLALISDCEIDRKEKKAFVLLCIMRKEGSKARWL